MINKFWLKPTLHNVLLFLVFISVQWNNCHPFFLPNDINSSRHAIVKSQLLLSKWKSTSYLRQPSIINIDYPPRPYSNRRFQMKAATTAASTAAMSTTSNAIASIRELTMTLRHSSSPVSTIQAVSSLALATPPSAYFLALILAGFGVPISEDCLCIIVGSILSQCGGGGDTSVKKWAFIWSLYAGIVLSDAITFWIGRALRVGLLEPVRKALNIGTTADPTMEVTETNDTYATKHLQTRKRKRDKINDKIKSSGNYIGFVARISAGMRVPLMLLAGFTNEVPFVKYFGGTLLGACVSLPIQLAVGYWMSRSISAVVLS